MIQPNPPSSCSPSALSLPGRSDLVSCSLLLPFPAALWLCPHGSFHLRVLAVLQVLQVRTCHPAPAARLRSEPAGAGLQLVKLRRLGERRSRDPGSETHATLPAMGCSSSALNKAGDSNRLRSGGELGRAPYPDLGGGFAWAGSPPRSKRCHPSPARSAWGELPQGKS
jgi:hypothetical protein